MHLAKVCEGLTRLQSLGDQLNVDKCHIAESKVTLLGHVVSAKGIESDPSTISSLVSLPSPTSTKQLISFLQKKSLLFTVHLTALGPPVPTLTSWRGVLLGESRCLGIVVGSAKESKARQTNHLLHICLSS